MRRETSFFILSEFETRLYLLTGRGEKCIVGQRMASEALAEAEADCCPGVEFSFGCIAFLFCRIRGLL